MAEKHPVEVWRCAPCDVTWLETVLKPCWSCGERPTHVKPYRPSLIIGAANMGNDLVS